MTEQEFKQVVLPLSSKLYSICLRVLQNQHEAKDCLQDVFVKLWTKREYLMEVKSVAAFATTVTKNLCLDRIKLRKPTVDIDSTLYVESSFYASEQAVHEDNRLALVDKAVAQLPAQQQQIFNLRDIEHLEFDEIAERLDLSPEHVRVLLSRARKRIREIVEKEIAKHNEYERH